MVIKPFVRIICFLLFSVSYAQNTVTGKVLDRSTGQPLPGATITNSSVPGSGVITDFDGLFEVKAKNGDLIKISYLGFEPLEVKVTKNNLGDLFLEPQAVALDDVVVTALGIAKQEKSLGYAVQKVDQQIFSNNTNLNFMNRLSGQVAGLNISSTSNGPASSNRILIRGSSSLTGSDQPLFVIDGAIVSSAPGENNATQDGGLDYGDPLSTINPDDIKSVTVLKGPGATALYGSLGTNGVIVIETKTGNREGISVQFSSSVIVDQPYIFPDFQNSYGRGSQGQFTRFNTLSYGPSYDGTTITNWLGNEISYSPVLNQMQDFFRDGITENYDFQVSGGKENSQFRISGSLLNSESIMPNSGIDRKTLNLSYNTNLNSAIRLATKVSYFNQDAFNRPNLGGSPDNPVRNFYIMPRSVVLSDLFDYIDESGKVITWDGRTEGSFNQNPYWGINLNTNQDIRNRLLANFNLNMDITPWLSANARAGWDYIADSRERRIAENTVYKTSPVASFSYSVSDRLISNYDVLLTAKKEIQNFDFGLTGGISRVDNNVKSLSSSGDDLVNPDLWVINNFREIIATQGIAERRLNSVFTTLDTSWKKFLYLNLTWRNDWSSVLPSENRSFSYWSSNLSWVLTDTWDNLPNFLDFAKLRSSVAKVGNANSLTTSALFFNYTTSTGHLGQPFTRVPRIGPNSFIRPESTLAYEFGIDVRMFKGRLGIDASVYQNDSFDQIFTAPVASSTGFQDQWINSGSIRNQGLEIILRTNPVETSGFNWNSNINYSLNRNKVLELTEELPLLILGGGRSGISVQARTNERSDLLVGSRYLKDASGNLILDAFNLPQIEIEEDGNADFILGQVQPDFMLGWTNSLTFKNVSVYFALDAQIGGSFYSSSYASGTAAGTLENTLLGRKGWYTSERERVELGYRPEEWIPTGGVAINGLNESGLPISAFLNPERYWSRLSGINEANVFDASFVRLTEVSVGYSLPKSFTSKLHLKNCSISVFGSNLGYLLRNTTGFSPQASLSSGKAQGIETFAFPTTRSVGAKINFQL